MFFNFAFIKIVADKISVDQLLGRKLTHPPTWRYMIQQSKFESRKWLGKEKEHNIVDNNIQSTLVS